MVPDIQFLSEDESTGSSDSIAPNNQFKCNHCLRTFNNELQLSKHKNNLSTRTQINAVKHVTVRNQNENNTQSPTFIPPPTSQSQRAFYHNESPPPPPPRSHTLLFSMNRVGGNNCHFHPYMRSIREVPTFPPHHDNKIDESLGRRTTDLISLIDKNVDSVSMEELPMVWGRTWFEVGSSSKKNDINLDLKL